MTDLKDRLPAAPAAKPENQISQAAPPRPMAAAPRVVPPSAGGMGHAMMPLVRTATTTAPSPQIARQVAPQIAPQVAATPAATAKPISQPAPLAKPAMREAVPEIVINAINSTAPWEGYRKFAVAFGFEAAVEAGATWIRGLERLQDELTAMASAQMAASAAAAKELADCATIEDLMTMQALLTWANFDRLSAATAKISQISVTVAKESLMPISEGLVASTDQLIATLSH